MNLKNYTSGVPVSRTVAHIEDLLAGAGASGILKDYKDGTIESLSFQIKTPEGKTIAIKLPANHRAVEEVMQKEVRRPHRGTREKVAEQALRTSWKLMSDWVEVQLSLIQMQQADLVQVFLPYIWNGQRTFYDHIKANGFKALPAPE